VTLGNGCGVVVGILNRWWLGFGGVARRLILGICCGKLSVAVGTVRATLGTDCALLKTR
jgi:hypothetical protein